MKCPNDSISLHACSDDEVYVVKHLKLRATINHSSTLNDWALIRDEGNNNWLKCNNTSITKASFKDLSNNSSYIFIYCTE